MLERMTGRGPIEFLHELAVDDVPPPVLQRARACLLDLLAVAAVGQGTRLSELAREHAVRYLPGADRAAALFFDGRATSPLGAAFANAATIDAMDGHDGHRLTKGHAGAAVLPAAMSVLGADPAAAVEDLLTTLLVGYEVANRAGVALHGRAGDYHSSGSWNALGAAAVAARLLRLTASQTAHALGIAEYQAPRAPMMRCIDHPTMVKDSSAWGAQAGVSAALLAGSGFTGAPAALVADPEDGWDDLGRRWTILEQYFKPYPVCRWSQPAVHAVIGLVEAYDIGADEVRRIGVSTFHEATRLATRHPEDTEQAQYSLPFAVACATVHRGLSVEDIAAPERVPPQVRRLAATLELRESPELTGAFPARRIAEVTLELTDGRRLVSGPTEAPGDPEDELTPVQLEHKFRSWAASGLGPARAERLLELSRRDGPGTLSALLAEIYAPA